MRTVPTDWPDLVCPGSDYLEVAQIGAIPVSAVSEVRVAAKEWKVLTREAMDHRKRGLPLRTKTQAEINAADAISRWATTHGVKIVTVS